MNTQNKGYYSLDRAEMADLFPVSVKTVLDVGCGEGNFGELLKKRFGCEVWGIEPTVVPFDKAKVKLDQVFNSDFLPDILPDKKFDVISFNDVLEHMADPWVTLISCKQKLTSTGCIVASIPNILYFHDFAKFLMSRDWEYDPIGGIFDKTHLRFFTRKSIYRLFQESGYEVVRIEGIRPTDSKKFTLFNLFTFGYWAESQFLQFAVVAKPA